MTSIAVATGLSFIPNLIGTGLNGGSVYVGVANQDPQINPQPVFWDAALTIPASQPLVTIGGYITRDGAPAIAYAASSFSLRVLDRFGIQVLYRPEVADDGDVILADLAASTGASLVGYQLPAAGSAPRTIAKVGDERASLYDFMSTSLQSQIATRGYAGDLSDELQAAIDGSNGYTLLVPPGLYDFSAPLVAGKATHLRIEGQGTPYTSDGGSELRFTGASGVALTCGVADGNPDTTGATRDFRIENVALTTPFNAGGETAIKVQNTSIFRIANCKFRGYRGKIVHLYGGNVLGEVSDNDIQGVGLNNNDGIFLEDYQFGNFVTKIRRNHVYQVNRAMCFSEGRSLLVEENTMENIIGCLYEFFSAGYISLVSFLNNYAEGHRGPVFKGDAYTGLILKMIHRGNEYFASGDAAFPNGPLGTLSKTRVLEHDERDNYVVNAARNATAGLLLPAVFSTVSMFDATTTAALGNQTNSEYQDDLVASMSGKNLLTAAQSSFGATTGTTAGTYPNIVTGGAPSGWTNSLTAGTWALAYDGLAGPSCVTAAAADFDACTVTIALTPVARARYFALGFTARGWVAVVVNGSVVFDAGSNVAAYLTRVITIDIPVSAASFTLTFRRNTGNPLGLAEAGLYEIGGADRTDAGALGGALNFAVQRLMKRGAY